MFTENSAPEFFLARQGCSQIREGTLTSPPIIFEDKHSEVQEGNWKLQAIGCLVLTAIIPSKVTRLA